MVDFDKRYRVKNWPAVAVRVAGYPQVWDACITICEDEEGNEYEEEVYGEGEWIDDVDSGNVVVIMVGDDKKHEVSADDLIPLDELDYCAECGQVGCTHDGRDRD
jgi:hypothetical protein